MDSATVGSPGPPHTFPAFWGLGALIEEVPMRTMVAVGVTLLLIGTSACGEAMPDASGESHLGDLPRLRAEAEMRMGDFSDPDIGFSRVSGVDIDYEGNVYVMEALVPEIRVYSPDGVILRRIGGRGGGPGKSSGSWPRSRPS